jgi:prephenate dehydratase
VFVAVQAGDVQAGVIPFENSTNGSVVFTLDDLADRNGRFPDLVVTGEVYVDVHHYLFGHKNASTGLDEAGEHSGTSTPTVHDPNPLKPKSKPLSSLKHVRRLYSHPQAFGQCNAFISTYLKAAEIFEVSSTSKAADIVSRDTTGTWAAISSQLAGEMYGVDTLAEAIEDRDDNTTRFLIISNIKAPSPGASLRSSHEGRASTGSKSFVSFTVPHSSPGALAEVLACFQAFDLNLTSINSRPSLVKPFQYLFFVEFEGHRERDPEGRVKGALDKINRVAESWRWLGSWERQR